MKIKELTPYYKNKVRENLNTIFDLATPCTIENGKNWYKNVNKTVLTLNKRYKGKFSQFRIAGVISALSPRNKWERNIYDAEQVLNAVMDNVPPEEIKVCTFTSNKLKAFEIAKGSYSIEESSRKTFSFVQNIAFLDPDKITIDVWHLRAMFGKTVTSGLTPKRYDQLAKITIEEATKVGLKGYEYQAIIWETIRERESLI